MTKDQPLISTVLLNWNRLHLLKKTVDSYLGTISVPYELIIVDNNSSDGSREFIESISKLSPHHKSILLTENMGGGESINIGLEKANGSFFHISENDYEYFEGWDKNLLKKFEVFPELGQIALTSSKLARNICKVLKKANEVIYVTPKNVMSTCIFRRELWDKGVRWKTVKTKGKFHFPADVEFSKSVQENGLLVAWNDKDVAKDWGHDPTEWKEHLEYYLENVLSKPRLGIEGFRKKLKRKGYELIMENGKYKIEKL